LDEVSAQAVDDFERRDGDLLLDVIDADVFLAAQMAQQILVGNGADAGNPAGSKIHGRAVGWLMVEREADPLAANQCSHEIEWASSQALAFHHPVSTGSIPKGHGWLSTILATQYLEITQGLVTENAGAISKEIVAGAGRQFEKISVTFGKRSCADGYSETAAGAVALVKRAMAT
jgi:hypothetical protein